MQVILAMTLAAAVLAGADATGVWSGTLTVTGGDSQSLSAHLILKQDGDTVTGTAGPNATEQQPIRSGKVENGRLTFELPLENSVMKFTLEQKDDELTGPVTRERDGEVQRATLSVKRTR